MANHTTGAQRRNKQYNEIWSKYHEIEAAKKDFLPTCTEYAYFLDKAVEKLKISKDEARDKYGSFTYGQWKELLQVW
ncbi:MAG: hypothetical protein KA007_01245 [Candidatus Pacebacteria bacterium]|nr:hypothetical protein [Candidatus Paceibacterota bacterium]